MTNTYFDKVTKNASVKTLRIAAGLHRDMGNVTHAQSLDDKASQKEDSYRDEEKRFADAFIARTNADHEDVMSFSRDACCLIRNHIEDLRRRLASAEGRQA